MDQERRFSVTDLVVCAILFAATAIAYYGASDLEFVSYDDPLYVTQNSMVQKGLTVDGIMWALRTDHANNWNPLTWISHMVDYEIHGADAQGHHGTSLLLHIANSLLLYLLLRSLTGATWRSAVVAALAACIGLTRAQVETWRDDNSLCRHALKATDNNFIAHSVLANHLMTIHKFSEAKHHYVEARRIFPAEPRLLINLGKALLKLEEYANAESALREALVHYPQNETVHFYLAWALAENKMLAEAEKHLREAVRIAPDHPVARFNLGVLLLNKKDFAGAEIHFAETVRLDPENESAKKSLRFCRSRTNRTVVGKE